MKGHSITVLFYAINIFFNISIICYYISTPFKLRIWNNYCLFIWTMGCLIYDTLIIVYSESAITLLDLSPET